MLSAGKKTNCHLLKLLHPRREDFQYPHFIFSFNSMLKQGMSINKKIFKQQKMDKKREYEL